MKDLTKRTNGELLALLKQIADEMKYSEDASESMLAIADLLGVDLKATPIDYPDGNGGRMKLQI